MKYTYGRTATDYITANSAHIVYFRLLHKRKIPKLHIRTRIFCDITYLVKYFECLFFYHR